MGLDANAYGVFLYSQSIKVHDSKLILDLQVRLTSRLLIIFESFGVILSGEIILAHSKLHPWITSHCTQLEKYIIDFLFRLQGFVLSLLSAFSVITSSHSLSVSSLQPSRFPVGKG